MPDPRGCVDLRSDTVTLPTAAMRTAMALAEVGDDVLGEDPTVRRLEEATAAAFGREAALFVPSGTMGNQIAVRLVVPPAGELLLDADAHVVNYEGGGAAQHGAIQTRTLVSPRGLLDPAAVADQFREPGYHTVRTSAVAVEQTHNRGGGAVYPVSTLTALRDLTRAHGAALHCDGARIWNAAVASGTPLATYGGLFDTLSVCYSKGLGAPIGSALVGDAAVMDDARLLRRRLGGGWRQAGVVAAGALYALEHHVDRLGEDHARARRLAEVAADVAPHLVDPATVETNIVPLDLSKHGRGAHEVHAALRDQGVLVGVVGPRRVRLVLHLDVTDDAVSRTETALRAVLGAD